MLAAAVHDAQQLYIVRFLLGVAEAGFFPGVVLYLTYWFRQREQAEAIALFMTALPVVRLWGHLFRDLFSIESTGWISAVGAGF